MVAVRDVPVRISELTMFGPWKRVDSILHPLFLYLIIRPTPHWAPPALDGRAAKQVPS